MSLTPNKPDNGTITFGYTDGTEERITVSPARIENDGRYYLITMKDRYGGLQWPPKLMDEKLANALDIVEFVVLTYDDETFSGTIFDVGPTSLEMRKDIL